MDKEDFIDFQNIRKSFKIHDNKLFSIYLREIFKDLSFRAESDKKLGVSKITFIDYMKLPIFISDKLFSSFDKDNDEYLSYKEFSTGLFNLYFGNFEETLSTIFDVYDFDKDGKIVEGDVRLLLSHLPLKYNEENIIYKHQMESLDEINEIIFKTFQDKKELNFIEFSSVIETNISDIYIQLLCFFYQKRPFSEENVNAYLYLRRKSVDVGQFKHQQNCKNNCKLCLSEVKKIRSPSKNTHFSPVDNYLRKISQKKTNSALIFSFNNNEINKVKNEKTFFGTPEISAQKGMIRMPNKIEREIVDNSKDINEIIKNTKNMFDSPSIYLKNQPKIFNFDLTKSICMIDNFSLNSDRSDERNVIFEGTIYKLTEKKNMKSYWLVLIGKDIFYYKSSEKSELKGMHNLSGCFVSQSPEFSHKDKNYYSFSIIFTLKERKFYVTDKYLQATWINQIKKAIGYENFLEFYQLYNVLGEGKFGVVREGVHKKTGCTVAIKMVKKEKMNNSDLEMMRSELDIMKLCQHPNIVRLLDHFENDEYIFLVMELLSGKNLNKYLVKNRFKFTEEKASNIVHQIASGLKYLHQYGVVHRDLKPDNIMLSDTSSNPIFKIMDFGFSKVLGPNERVADGFGTLSFVAPEVLVRRPYNKQIDIWSLGVILYYILSGDLPFDDEDDNEEKIAKKTVFEEVTFPKEKWNNRSLLCIDLISKCLVKNPEKRITIDNFIDHEWIQTYINQ